MTSLARLRKKIDLAEDLTGIVDTMKTLAAVNMRQFDQAAESIGEYVRTVELGLQVALREVQPPTAGGGRCGWVILGSDQGLCGGFNERVTRLTLESLGAERGPIVVVGHRVARRLEDSEIEIAREFRTPSSIAGVTELVLDLLVELSEWRESDEIDEIRVLHNAPRQEGGFEPQIVRLLPLDREWLEELGAREWKSRSLPTTPHGYQELFHWLVREWLFARLYLAGAASLSAENSARLLATQAASQSLSERLHNLRSRYRRERQETITEELLDLHR